MCKDRIWILLTRKLSGEATLTEVEELDVLISHLPEGSHTIEKITSIWNASSTHDNDFMEATYLAHLERMKDSGVMIDSEGSLLKEMTYESSNSSKKWFSFKNISLVALISITLLGGWFLLSSRTSAEKPANIAENFGEIKTRKGSRTKLKLPDGSDVWLNAGSKLNYNKDFEKGNREVYLTGEAFFDVVKDVNRPFIIHTTAINVTVLGTQFNVKAYSEDVTTETSLLRGSVEVVLKNDPSKKYLLKPNQKLVLSNEALLSRVNNVPAGKSSARSIDADPEIRELAYLQDESNTNVESSWTRNILSFEDELFSEVAKKMERWYDVTIQFKNKRWAREYMSGSFENENLEQALKALKFTTGFNYKTEGKTITVY